MRVFHNSMQYRRRDLLVSISSSWSRFFQSVCRPGLDASGVPVGETSRSRCGAYREDIETPALVCKRLITNRSGAGTPYLIETRRSLLQEALKTRHAYREKFTYLRVFHKLLNVLRSTGRSRGTGPRATVTGTVTVKNATRTVGRGPVPRQAAIYRKLAGDRPPRYGNRNGFFTAERPPSP